MNDGMVVLVGQRVAVRRFQEAAPNKFGAENAMDHASDGPAERVGPWAEGLGNHVAVNQPPMLVNQQSRSRRPLDNREIATRDG